MNNNPIDIFSKRSAGSSQSLDGVMQSLIVSKGLEEKTKQLIYIAMKAAQGDETAVSFYVPMAKKLGATKEEVVDRKIIEFELSVFDYHVN